MHKSIYCFVTIAAIKLVSCTAILYRLYVLFVCLVYFINSVTKKTREKLESHPKEVVMRPNNAL